MRGAAACTLAAALAAGCSFSSTDSFIQGANYDPCDNAIPVCSYTAGCRLTEGENYIEGSFPGYTSFIVPTESAAQISLILYFQKQDAPGTDTDIVWYEPGCRDQHDHYLPGIDLFRQVGDDRLWTVAGTVYQAGDHLVTMQSDATCSFLLKVEIDPMLD